MGEDGSKYDDRRFFAVQAGGGVPVAVLEARRHEIPYLDEAYYLEQALASAPAGAGGFDVANLSLVDLADEPLEKYKVLFCVNLPALDAKAAERLAGYVAAGGNLVWICGDNVEPAAYNRMDQLAGGRLLPSQLFAVRAIGPNSGRDSWHVGYLDADYPPLSGLNDPASLYESVLIYRHLGMAVEKGPARALVRLDDGDPLLVERGVGKGRTLLLGAAATPAWTNLPLRPIFLPLVVRLTFHLAKSDRIRTDVLAGQPLEYRLTVVRRDANVAQPPSAGASDVERQTQPRAAVPHNTAVPQLVELVPPDGETLRLKTSGEFHYTNTYEIGIYVLRLPAAERPAETAYAVNFDPAEADPAKIEPAELEELLGGVPLIVADNPDDLSATFARLREGKSLWAPFLAAVLIVLVFETFLSNRFGSKA